VKGCMTQWGQGLLAPICMVSPSIRWDVCHPILYLCIFIIPLSFSRDFSFRLTFRQNDEINIKILILKLLQIQKIEISADSIRTLYAHYCV
jgi:hypothetical protein